MTPAQTQAALPTATLTPLGFLSSPLAGGQGGISVGYPSRRLLRTLPARNAPAWADAQS